MTQVVLLAGSSGMLGSRIAHHLQRQPEVQLRLLVRPDSAGKQGRLQPLLAAGAEAVEGDLSDFSSLERATEGVNVVVSAVQGGPDVIIDGQEALAIAAKANGAGRILPSDFSLDFFKATPGEHPSFNWRQEASRRISEVGLEQINVLQGAFLDMMFWPGSPFFDFEKNVVSYWGDGNQPLEATTIEDTAKMTALVALDRDAPPGKFSFWSERLSFNGAADIAQRVTGKTFQRISLGNEPALRAAIAAAPPETAMMLAYAIYFLNGQTSLDVQNAGRYPEMALEKYEDVLKRRLAEGV